MFLPFEQTVIIDTPNSYIYIFNWKFQNFEQINKLNVLIPIPYCPNFIYSNNGLIDFLNLYTSLTKKEDDENDYNGESLFKKMSKLNENDLDSINFLELIFYQVEIFNSNNINEFNRFLSLQDINLKDFYKNYIDYCIKNNYYFVLCDFTLNKDENINSEYFSLAPILISIDKNSNNKLIYPHPIIFTNKTHKVYTNVYLLSKNKLISSEPNLKPLYLNYLNEYPVFLKNIFRLIENTDKLEDKIFLSKYELEKDLREIKSIEFYPSNELVTKFYTLPDLVSSSSNFNNWLEEKNKLIDENINKRDDFIYILKEFCIKNGRLPKRNEFKNLLTSYRLNVYPYNPYTNKLWEVSGGPGDISYTLENNSCSIKFIDFYGNSIYEIKYTCFKAEHIKQFLSKIKELENIDTLRLLFLLICKYFSEYPLKIIGPDSLGTMNYVENLFKKIVISLIENKYLDKVNNLDNIWNGLLKEFEDKIEKRFFDYIGDEYLIFKDPILSVALEESINLNKFKNLFINSFNVISINLPIIEKVFLQILITLLLENINYDRSGSYKLLLKWLNNKGIVFNSNSLQNYPILFYLYLLWIQNYFNNENINNNKTLFKVAILFISDNWEIVSDSLKSQIIDYMTLEPSLPLVYLILHNYEDINILWQELPFKWINNNEFKYKKEFYTDIITNYFYRNIKLQELVHNLFQSNNNYLKRQVSILIDSKVYKNLPKELEDIIVYHKQIYEQIDEILESAWVYYKMDLFNEAMNEYKKVLDIDPEDADMHYGLGLVYSQLRQHDNAIKEFEKTIQIDPTFSSAYNNLGTIYKRLKQYNDSLYNYQKAITLNPKKAIYHFNLGHVYYLMANKEIDNINKERYYNDAIKSLKTAVKLQPNLDSAHLYLANIYFERKELSDAKLEYKEVLKNNPKNIEAYIKLAQVYQLQKEYSKAIECLKKVLEIEPNNLDILLQIGINLEKDGKLTEAVTKYKEILDIHPQYKEAYFHLSSALIKLNDLNYAEEMCLKAISIDPNYLEIYNQLGIIYFKKKELNKALDIYSQALKISPNNLYILNNLALIYDELGQKDKAIDLYLGILKQTPNNSTVYNNLGFIYFDLNNLEQAIEAFNNSIKLESNNYDAYAGLAICYSLKGDKKEAINNFNKACSINPKCKDIEYLKQELYWNEQALSEAKKILKYIEGGEL